MTDCDRLEACPFFHADESDPGVASAKRGLMALYCKGAKKENCVRLAVVKKFGGPTSVPKNMMPNGLALPGTDESGWDEAVIKFKREFFLR